jgi:hypothetical protein
MRGFLRQALAIAVLLLAAPAVQAACSSPECPDEQVIAQVRATIAAACDCAGKNHGRYVKCAKSIIKSEIAQGRLPAACKKTVGRCEAKSTCGLKKAAICCAVTNGLVTAKMTKRKGGKCGGRLCTDPMALADACSSDGSCVPAKKGVKAFRAVQKVFQQNCTLGCHTTSARQGNLVLDSEDVSYVSLVDRPAAHPEAQGLLRVKSGDPENSYLVQKLRGKGAGDEMPQGRDRLPDSVIKMVEDWIRRGAHATAEECPVLPVTEFRPLHGNVQHTLCDDEPVETPPYEWKPEPPLEVPAASDGIQLYVPPKLVEPGTEWETCYAFRPDWAKIAADMGLEPGQRPTFRQQTYRMHSGSHHLLLYAYFGEHPEDWAEGFFPCLAANCFNENAGDCPEDAGSKLPIGGTQVAGTRYEVNYPEGVGIPVLSDDMVLIANIHYTNPFSPPQPVNGEAWLNLYFHRPNEFKVILDGIFAINAGDLLVEPYQSRTISRIWQPRGLLSRAPANAAVFQLFGHMHKRGVEFKIDFVKDGKCSGDQKLCGRDGDCRGTPNQTCQKGPAFEDSTIYYTTQWDHAPVMDFEKPYFLVNKDQGLRWTCTHTNGREGDPDFPPKRCTAACANSCGWDDASRTCTFRDGRVFGDGQPMPLVFGELADDDMCNMFGYFLTQEAAATLP